MFRDIRKLFNQLLLSLSALLCSYGYALGADDIRIFKAKQKAEEAAKAVLDSEAYNVASTSFSAISFFMMGVVVIFVLIAILRR
ncbi:hypothetical protein N9W34_04770 [Rickettsiales bacterium]|nr:hypothetical protein [Rickettsiales bacterium]